MAKAFCFHLPVTFSSAADFLEIGETRALSFGSDVESALVDIAVVTLLELGSALVGDVFSLSDESCLRLRYSLMDNWTTTKCHYR